MGVELQHTVVYGYELPSLEMEYEEYEEYRNRDASNGDFVIFEDGRSGKYCVAGIVERMTGSNRRGQPRLPVTRLDETPDPVLVEAMDQTVEKLSVEPLYLSSFPTIGTTMRKSCW